MLRARENKAIFVFFAHYRSTFWNGMRAIGDFRGWQTDAWNQRYEPRRDIR
jgi:hypothetical protein